MSVFDYEKYVSNLANFEDGINNETLGCHLFSVGGETLKLIKFCIVQYIIYLIIILLDTKKIFISNTLNLIKWSSNINDCGISAIDFDIKTDEPKYNELYASGETGMTSYLSKYLTNI